MKIFSLAAAVLVLGLSLGVNDAEAAKRLGGGKSSGMQRQNTTEQAPGAKPGAPNTANSTAAAPAAPAAATAAAGAAAQSKRSWMGPLAGIAAGLGLAALASHLGFGDELASMLMIGLAVMAVLMVVGFIMRKRAASALQGAAKSPVGMPQYAAATANAQPAEAPAHRSYDVSMPAATGSGSGSMIGANLAPVSTSSIPADFDVPGFVRNAKVQFIRLQAANDAGNAEALREFTTPEMFAELKMDLAERGAVTSHIDVVHLDADVIDVTEEAHQHVVSVRFTGQVREDQGQPEAINEVWHLSKPRQGNGGWVLAGIQQMQ